ncbi:uncharacterized protein LOC142488433 isoform X3 [Ascaphus truei]|uniref:uncharacterized protein LOC142488433 isoform X3 n=1 Tax=Ascaphus truei TaxID=8439 RepID=UPI003F5A33E4
MDPRLISFPVDVPERLEIKSEKEEPNTEDHVTSIKSETVPFPVSENGLNEEQNLSSDASRSCPTPRSPEVPKNNDSCHILDMCKEPVPHDGEFTDLVQHTAETDSKYGSSKRSEDKRLLAGLSKVILRKSYSHKEAWGGLASMLDYGPGAQNQGPFKVSV